MQGRRDEHSSLLLFCQNRRERLALIVDLQKLKIVHLLFYCCLSLFEFKLVSIRIFFSVQFPHARVVKFFEKLNNNDTVQNTVTLTLTFCRSQQQHSIVCSRSMSRAARMR